MTVLKFSDNNFDIVSLQNCRNLFLQYVTNMEALKLTSEFTDCCDRKTDKQTDRQTDTQTDTQTDRERQTRSWLDVVQRMQDLAICYCIIVHI